MSRAESHGSKPGRENVHDLEIPPYSITAEQAVLGALMIDAGAWEAIEGQLVEADFYRADHRLIWRAMALLAERDCPRDAVTLYECLQDLGKLDETGGLAYLATLAKETPSAANIAAYAEIVREKALLREMMAAGAEIHRLGLHPGGRDTVELLDQAEGLVLAIAERRSRGVKGPRRIKMAMAGMVDGIERRFQSDSLLVGRGTGFADLDRETLGFEPGDVIVVAGRPSMGKTSLAMQFAEQVATRERLPAAVFSMEMPEEQLSHRLVASIGRIPLQHLRSGRLEDDEWPRMTSAVNVLADAPLFIDDSPALTVAEVRARARRVKREEGGLGLIVLDYLQLMSGSGRSRDPTRNDEIGEITRGLKQLAKELSVPVIALSQLNRNLEQRTNKRPVMSDLRESGSIEQDADLILFIYRDEVYNKETADKGTAEIIIAKQRNGPVGTVRLTFLGQYTRFENFVPPGEPDYSAEERW